MRLREDEVLEHLILRNALNQVEDERRRDAIKRAKEQMEQTAGGLDPWKNPVPPKVEVRDDEEARKIADNPLPGITDPEWLEWERQALDPTKDL